MNMQIIPAIDIIDGKCVRLKEGDYDQLTAYETSPLEMAKQYEAHGITRLHLVDLDGAKKGEVCNWKVAEQLAAETSLEIDFGGGVKSIDSVKRIRDLGIRYITIGSMAAKNPAIFQEWIDELGAEAFLLGADTKNKKVMVGGWLESTSIDLIPYMQQYFSKGITQIFCTDISKDGNLAGPATKLYQEIKQQIPSLFLIASGGVSGMDDLLELAAVGCDGAIVGKAIYENRISLKELENYIIGNN
ncbi:MAG: 1-(5-phosphoribosyl)-5-[(5-phosphoribosylamino)methylideneamino]imidazole-4-carboxamide isomerase [Bacteroidota bacterium]|jgi:phosphoribosylformimino-5-aminoimidazole carboxamide ribotide isomerase